MSAELITQWVCVECRDEGILTTDRDAAARGMYAHNETFHEPPEQPGDEDA